MIKLDVAWHNGPMETALVWLLRIVLFFLAVSALVSGSFEQALSMATILGVHGLVYWLAPHIRRRELGRWAITLADILLGGFAFYLAGSLVGLAEIVGLCVAAIVASRLSLSRALAVNAAIWLLFTLPLLYPWIGQGAPLPLPVLGYLVAYLALTLAVDYLASQEARRPGTGEDTSVHLRQLTKVYEVAQSISSTLEMSAVLDLVVGKAVEILNAKTGSLMLLDRDDLGKGTGELVFRAVVGPAAEALVGKRLPPGKGIADEVFRTGQGRYVNGAQVDRQWHALPECVSGPGTVSILCVPLVSRDRPIGVLEVVNRQDDLPFGDEDEQLLRTFAAHAAIALENARLYEETSRRLRQVNTLYEVGRSLTTLDTDRVLDTIAEQTVVALSVELCGVFLHEGHGSEEAWAVLKAVCDPTGAAQDLLGSRFRLDERGGLDELLGESGYVVIEAAEADERPGGQLRQMLGVLDIRSCLLVGLYLHDELHGLVVAAERSQARSFSAEEIQLCQALVHQAALAVGNARLYERTDEALNRRLQELAAVEEIDHELGASLDYDRIINLVLKRAIEACGAGRGAIGILMPDGQHLDARYWHSEQPDTSRFSTLREWAVDRGVVGRVVRTGQATVVDDVSSDPDCAAIADETRSQIAVPIKREDRMIGVLNLESDQRSAFTEDDLRFMEHLADHAGIAIDNARMFQREQQRFEQTQLLLRISEAIGSTLDLTETVRRVAREMCHALEADMAGVYLVNEAGTHLRSVAGYHVPKDRLELYRAFEIPIRGHGFVEEAFAAHQAVYSIDPASDPRMDPTTIEAFPNRTTLFAPMISRDEPIGGVYLVWWREDRTCTEAELQVASAIAWQAGAAVENVLLFEAQERKVHELGILFETSAAISSSLELGEVLRTVARKIADALDVTACSISDWDPESGLLRTLIDEDLVPNLVPSDVGKIYSLDDYPSTARVLHHRQPQVIQVSDPEADPAERELLEDLGHKSLLMVPMVARDRVVGLLELFEGRRVREFSADDIRLCRVLANQAAVAIENARLYEQTDERLQARLDELVALQRTAQELNATLALDRILQVVLESAIQTTGATHGNVLLIDLDTRQLSLRAAEGYSVDEEGAIEDTLLQLGSNSFTLQVAQSGQARIVDDARLEACSVCVRTDTRSALAIPIFYEGVVVGLIQLRHTRVAAFSHEDLTFVEALAEQAAIAIGNALRFEEQVAANTALRRRTDQMDSLLAIGQKLRADATLEDTLEEVAYAIQETVGFNYVLVNVVRGVPPMMCRVAAAGVPLSMLEEMKTVTQPVERYERILRDEYRQGLCYFYPFQKRDDWETDLDTQVPMAEIEDWQEGQWHPHDMLLAPLRGSGGRLLGHVSVDEPRDGYRPSRQVLEALSVFASQAAIAVENANLYAEAQRRADSLARLNEVGRSLTQVLEPAQVLSTVVRAASELLRGDCSTIFQVDGLDGTFAPVASHGVELEEIRGLGFALGEGLVGHVAATGDPLLIPDTDDEPRFTKGPVPVRSMILVPIVAGGQVIGVLTVGSIHKRALTGADQVLLTTLADQAAVALESARLFSSTQQAAVRLSLLNEIGRRAAARLELQEMLGTTVTALHRNLGYFRVAVLLLDETGQSLRVAAADDSFWPVIPPDFRLKVGEGLIGTAAVQRTTVLVNDTARDKRYIRIGDWHAPASLSVPIKTGSQVTGVLHVEAEKAGLLTEEDAAALEIAADQLAVAIQNARLFQETQRRVAELATVNEIGRAISGALDALQLAEMIYMHVSKLLDTRNFHVALCDDEEECIHIEFLVENGVRQPPAQLKPGQGLIGHLISVGQPILLNRGTDRFHQEHGLTPVGSPAKSWLGVPMIAEDRVIGAIVIRSYDRENAFDEGHLNLLSTIAGQAAVAFQNASLFQERERRIAELAVLNEMSQVISSALELEDLLDTVHQQVSRIFDTTNFYVATYEEGDDEWTLAFALEHGRRQPHARYSVDAGLTGHIIRTGQALWLQSLQENVAFHGEQGIAHVGERAKSWLGVPLMAADQVVGAMAVQSYEEENLYGPQELAIFSTIAAQVAVAMRNAQLYRQIVNFSSELEERVEARTRDLAQALRDLTVQRDRAETLYRITSELGATLDLERVLQHALQLFADALGVEHGTITLLDQESGYLDLKAALGPAKERIVESQRTPLRLGVGLAGWILKHRKPVLVSDVDQDPRWIRIDGRELDVRSVVAAPLSLGGGDIMGVLTLGHQDVGYFSEEHLQLVTAAASQIAIAVNNSDLYAYITEQADQLGSMLQSQQAESAKSRAILESIADGVLVLDHNGRVLLVNPTAEELLGFSAMVIEGEHFRHMLGLGETAAQRQLAQALYSELRARLESAQDRAFHLHAGSVRLASGNRVLAANIAPLITTVGGAPGLVAALRDVSREAEVERLKNEFISTVSHELRTPMTSIKGYTDLLFLGMVGGLTDAQRSFLQIIKSNADRLTALVNDILDISRIETGRLRLTIESLDPGAIIGEAVLAFREQYREKDLVLLWKEPPELPRIRGDAARVTQVLNNLLANAWQYTPVGGRVTVTARPLDGFLQVSVADTGIGIGPDDIGRVFDRFFRADDPVVEEASGTGLGLSIAKMFVDMLGGEISVDSEVGVGSTFSFTLPLITTDVPEVSPEMLDPETAAAVPRRHKILVVEDDHDLALLLRKQLESDGYQVLLAGSGEDALWLAREEQPQLITLDIMLPDVDGFTVLERLKEHPSTALIPVIIVSILSEAEEGYALGAIDYVVKPFEEVKLLQSVREALAPRDGSAPQNLLVVDDDPDIRGFLEQALSFHGYQVWTASGGREALAHVQEEQPDLILLDLAMPGVDGYEVIRRLKSDNHTRPIPIIAITASPVDKERDKVRVLRMGAAHYVTKPLSIDKLMTIIKRAIVEKGLE